MVFLRHTLGIFIDPDSEWKRIRDDRSSFKQVFLSHVPFLALIPTISAYVGCTKVGWRIGSSDPARLSNESAILLCTLAYCALLTGVFLFGEFINWMSKTYGVGGTKDSRHYGGTALAVFVSTPLLLVGIFNVYPSVWVNALAMSIAGAYSVYLIYEGIPILMKIDKQRGFLFASSVVTVGLVLMVTAMIGTVLIWGVGIGPVYID